MLSPPSDTHTQHPGLDRRLLEAPRERTARSQIQSDATLAPSPARHSITPPCRLLRRSAGLLAYRGCCMAIMQYRLHEEGGGGRRGGARRTNKHATKCKCTATLVVVGGWVLRLRGIAWRGGLRHRGPGLATGPGWVVSVSSGVRQAKQRGREGGQAGGWLMSSAGGSHPGSRVHLEPTHAMGRGSADDWLAYG